MYINNYKIQWESWKHVLHGPCSFKADVKYGITSAICTSAHMQSRTKVLRQFSKTILYLNEIFFICSQPLSPKQCCKTLCGCLFVSNIEKGGGEGGYIPFTNLHQGKRSVIFKYLNNFCPWLEVIRSCDIKTFGFDQSNGSHIDQT